MRRVLLASLGALALVSCAAPLAPAAPTVDVTGNWRGVVVSPGPGYIDDGVAFSLDQQGSVVTGELEVPATYQNGVPAAYEPFGSLTGTVSGNRLSFTSTGEDSYAGRVISVSATVGQSNLAGSLVLLKAGVSGTYALTGQRVSAP